LISKNYKTMGMFWDLIQQSEIEEQKDKAVSLEQRVLFLEQELEKTRLLLIKTLHILEEQIGKDIDGDGKLG
jgi:hypothetical protein